MPKAKATLIWLPEAVLDLERLRDFIDATNPLAARDAAVRIVSGAERLREYPQSGRAVARLAGFRDLTLPFGAGAYVVRYRVAQREVIIVRVWHTREHRQPR